MSLPSLGFSRYAAAIEEACGYRRLWPVALLALLEMKRRRVARSSNVYVAAIKCCGGAKTSKQLETARRRVLLGPFSVAFGVFSRVFNDFRGCSEQFGDNLTCGA